MEMLKTENRGAGNMRQDGAPRAPLTGISGGNIAAAPADRKAPRHLTCDADPFVQVMYEFLFNDDLDGDQTSACAEYLCRRVYMAEQLASK
jgi:hypothetical protein